MSREIDHVGHWWVKGGERWVGLLEELASDSARLPVEKIKAFVSRLQAVVVLQEAMDEPSGGRPDTTG